MHCYFLIKYKIGNFSNCSIFLQCFFSTVVIFERYDCLQIVQFTRMSGWMTGNYHYLVCGLSSVFDLFVLRRQGLPLIPTYTWHQSPSVYSVNLSSIFSVKMSPTAARISCRINVFLRVPFQIDAIKDPSLTMNIPDHQSLAWGDFT